MRVLKQDADGITYRLDDAGFNWIPGPGRWSVAQCFDHLNLTNKLFLARLEESVHTAREQGLTSDGPYSYNFLSRWFFRFNEPPAKWRVKAPAKVAPAHYKRVGETVPEFLTIHDRLIELLKEASGLDLVKAKCPLPGLPIVKFNLGMTFWIVTAHDRRHIQQAREVCVMPQFPGRPPKPAA